ncbi:MAG: hypothetical protein JNL28_13200 [Planctomycetes bacterium]|nr:hypothetical protein [Planctomycetota bacterium]
MNGRLRLFLCGACVAIGAFHAPHSTRVLVQDLIGPYGADASAEAQAHLSWTPVDTKTGRVDAAGSDSERAGRTADRR